MTCRQKILFHTIFLFCQEKNAQFKIDFSIEIFYPFFHFFSILIRNSLFPDKDWEVKTIFNYNNAKYADRRVDE